MIDETVHLQNSPAQIPAVPRYSILQLLHSHLQSIGFGDSTMWPGDDWACEPAVPPVLESLFVTDKPSLILASNSPRRRQLLALAGRSFEVNAPDVDESRMPGEPPAEYVLRLAETKARAIPGGPDQVVLAADTAVVDEADVLGKPADEADAARMLGRLRGRAHQVYTGVAMLRLRDGSLLKEVCVTDVPMRHYSDEEIDSYVQSGDPLDKAGAYGIQHPDFRPVEELKGCYTSVMGLPMCYVFRMLRQMDLPPGTEIFSACESTAGKECLVPETILRNNT